MYSIRQYINIVLETGALGANSGISRAYGYRSWYHPSTDQWIVVSGPDSHAKVVAKYPEKFGLDLHSIDPRTVSDRAPELMNAACKNGWVRVASQNRQDISHYMIIEGSDLDTIIRVAKKFYFDQKGKTENIGLKVRSLVGDGGEEYVMHGNGAVKGALLQRNLPEPHRFGASGGYQQELAEGQLNEFADAPYNYSIDATNSNQREQQFLFTTSDGVKYETTIRRLKFYNGIDISFSKIGRGQIKGSPIRIYSTVSKIMCDFVAKEKPDRIMFSSLGKNPSREKLYDKFTKMVGRVLPDYSFSRRDDSDTGASWFFVRKDAVPPIGKARDDAVARNDNTSPLGEGFLTELANAPYRYIVKSKVGRNQSTLFQTDDKRVFVVYLAATTDRDEGSDGVILTFADSHNQRDLGISGGGDAFRIFATVTAILADYVNQQNPGYITFSADAGEDSRVVLYDRFAKRLPSKINGYAVKDIWRSGKDKFYRFERVSPSAQSA